MSITLYHGDCLDILPTLPDGSVDMVLCDLPYGTTACKWDVVIPFAPLWEQYRRVVKRNGAIVLFGSQPFTSLLITSNLRDYRYSWVWEKSVGTGFLDANRKPLKVHEDVAVFYQAQPTYNAQKTPTAPRSIKRAGNALQYSTHERVTTHNNGEAYPRSIIYSPKELGTQHPTQKPVALCEYLIRTYTNEGEVVLDNTMGSGTTGVACVNTGRDFIGIEKDAQYFAIAQKRIEAARVAPRQMELIA